MNFNIPSTLQKTLPLELQTHWEDLLSAHLTPAVNSIRINPLKNKFDTSNLEQVPWCQSGFYQEERPFYTADPLFHGGAYYVQEASSMFLDYVLEQGVNFNQTNYVLDLCAAPGGKSTLVASKLNEESLLVSNEVIQSRVNILNENITKWGQLNTWISNNDPIHFQRIPNVFNVMLIDAPCSGSGLFRKIPEYQNDWNMDLVRLCAERQKRILQDSYAALCKNGILVYMTCSMSQEENEDIVDYILENFDVSPMQFKVPEQWNIIETNSSLKGFGYRLSPHKLKGEGFFLTCFQKNDGSAQFIFPTKKIESKFEPIISKYLDTYLLNLVEQKEHLFALHQSHQLFMKELGSSLKWIRKGICLGKMIKNELIPDHELAMYSKNIFSNRIELSLNESIKYLQKENISIDAPQKGWYLVCYNKLPLGWIKNIGNRVNNYYPSNYRILSRNILTNR